VITLAAGFPADKIVKDKFSVKLTDNDDSTNVKVIRVVEISDSDNSITVMFGGANSGTYTLGIDHTDLGAIETTDVGNFVVESVVTDFSPKIGSIYGGTLITITGRNFGTVKTDNPVEIYMGY
jgi:hypothetical protein